VPVFIKSTVIDAPVHVVFGFHEREDALSMLAPAFPPMRIVSRTGGIRAGARVVIRTALFTWTAVHTGYQKNAFFVDEQIEGPFARWVHRHEFEDAGGSTRLTDRVEYRLRGGAIGNALFGWMVRIGLHQLFHHRHRVTKKFCEG